MRFTVEQWEDLSRRYNSHDAGHPDCRELKTYFMSAVGDIVALEKAARAYLEACDRVAEAQLHALKPDFATHTEAEIALRAALEVKSRGDAALAHAETRQPE